MGFDDLRNSRNWEDREYSICFVSRGFCNETHCIVSRFPSFAHCDEVYRGGHLFCGSFLRIAYWEAMCEGLKAGSQCVWQVGLLPSAHASVDVYCLTVNMAR